MELLIYLLKSATILTIFYLVYSVLLRKDTHFLAHRIYLILGLIGSFILPVLYFTRNIYLEAPATSTITTPLEIMSTSAASINSTAANADWLAIALLIYTMGCLIVLFRFLIQLRNLLILLRSNPSRQVEGFRYIRVSENIAPFSFFNYIVYNPGLHSEAELKMILKHERVHAFQWHSADIIIANILVMLQWANPMAWLYKKSIAENLEFLADNTTISEVSSKKEYQIALVRASSGQNVPALATNFYKSFIKKRIIMLNKSTSKKHNLLKIATVLPLIALFLWGFNVREEFVFTEPSEKIPAINSSVSALTESTSGLLTDSKDKFTGLTENSDAPETDLNSDKNGIAVSEETNMTVPTDFIEKKAAGTISMIDLKFKITKNTTDAELQKIKEQLKRDHGIDFSYSTTRNKSNEITAITVQYSGNGRNGNYSIQNDQPISDFIFYMNDDGESGFWSEEAEERQAEREAMRSERQQEMEERREFMRQEMEERREAMQQEMDEKRHEMREKMREQRTRIKDEDGNEVIILQEIDEESGDSDHDVKEYIIRRDKDKARIHRDQRVSVIKSDGHVVRRSKGKSARTLVIDKNTGDADLVGLKRDLSEEGIKLNYSRVKRNEAGQLTRIKIVVEKNDSKQSIISESDDGKPIDDIVIDLNN